MIDFIDGPSDKIAYEWVEGTNDLPPVVFIHGFKSDMGGTKSEFLKQYCMETGRDFLRFDVYAHGQSDGDFMDFTITKAVQDSEFMLKEALCRPAIIIGSSMGGWIAIRLMQTMPQKFHGFIGIAAAPDFTRKIYASLDDRHLAQLGHKGYIKEDSGYDEPYIFTSDLFKDGEANIVMDGKVDFDGKATLLQGKLDTSVDWRMAEQINAVMNGRAKIKLIEDGDHSLSRPQDLEVLKYAIEAM
jgi:esterase/lipase